MATNAELRAMVALQEQARDDERALRERRLPVPQRDPKDTLREIDERWQAIRKTAPAPKRVSLL